MQQTFTSQAIDQMRQGIRDAGGNEVFFLGRTDGQRQVVEIEILARGSREAVPAILQNCRFGDVVVHNHPSGCLEPSPADLEIASRLGCLGIGFHIIDNPVEHVYRVVEAFIPTRKRPIDPARIADLLGPSGVIAEALPDYEDRPEQLRMAFAVGEAFDRDRLAIIEAGTGTGKSLAYLVPSLLWSLANEERVVLSTNTINLQEQLIRKDIPLLQRSVNVDFRAVLVKGRGNYLCRRRLETARSEPELFENEHQAELTVLAGWAEETKEGSREELTFLPQEAVWEEVCCEADQCARVRCPDYQSCFFHRARRQAAQADILVVNHALLLADLALRVQTANYTTAAVLPPFDRVVIDEAHHLEDVATNFFSSQVTRFRFSRILNKLRHPRKPDKGILPRLLNQASQFLPDSEDELYRSLHHKVDGLLATRNGLLEKAGRDLENVGETLAAAMQDSTEQKGDLRRRVTADLANTPFWNDAAEKINALAAETGKATRAGHALLKLCETFPDSVAEKLTSVVTDLEGCILRLEGIAGDLAYFVSRDAASCAWIEVGRLRQSRGGGTVTRLRTAPLEVAAGLQNALYDRFRSVVLTSATLAVGNSFAYFKHRVGLDKGPSSRTSEMLLASPFDFERQALLAIPVDIPEPGRPGYPQMVRDLVEKAVLAAEGRTFVLFTAYSLLRRIHGELSPVLEARGHRCLRQGEDNRHRLLKTFTADPSSVLFATDSFWEGVDVPGRSLEQVVIVRLPFKVPTEPILEARAEAIEAAGGDSFMDYTVPQAALKFKQGFGRLIRHREDRGVVLILDSRVVKKSYGRIFLRSLPEAERVIGPTDEVLSRMATFFSG